MVDRRSKKISVLIFMFAIFILLVVVTASWLYRIYTEQTAFSEKKTMATVTCSQYYFYINNESVLYEDGKIYFEIENIMGKDIDKIVVRTSTEEAVVDMDGLGQGIIQPVTLPIEVIEWALVYPEGCDGANFKNLSFETG
ncbi:MAG: hypothetical protein V1729_03990 [Candidatus Woesearchaeota archaeon]